MWNQGQTRWKKGQINVEPRENKVGKGAKNVEPRAKRGRVLPSPWHRDVSADPAEQLRRATGREVGRSLENEFGSLNPWSVGEGVEHWEWGACSEGGLGEAEGGPPPMW